MNSPPSPRVGSQCAWSRSQSPFRQQTSVRFPRPPHAQPLSLRIGVGSGLLALHTIPLTALCYSQIAAIDWAVCALLYVQGALTMGVGLHRYFGHRSFRTTRSFQLLLGWLACTLLTDPIRFAGKHRLHHRYADSPRDPHSPRAGIWHCWIGSLIDEGYSTAQIRHHARDWQRYPELVWLERTRFLHAGLVALATAWLGGFSMFAIGFCLSRVICLHAVSAVNYFGHRSGDRRFDTQDASTNPVFWGWFTFGEGWHNNHHRFPTSARCGLARGEIDPAYRIIQLLEKIGWVWDVRLPAGPALPPPSKEVSSSKGTQRPLKTGSRFSTKARAALR